jgi:uncharacterized protein YjbJ (UPF0337 family)
MATETEETEDLGDKAKAALDDVAGAGTSDKIEGSVQEAVGDAKSAIGQATDNAELEGEGAADQVLGQAKQAEGEAESIGEKIQDFVEDAKDAVSGFFNKVKDALDGDDDEKKEEV